MSAQTIVALLVILFGAVSRPAGAQPASPAADTSPHRTRLVTVDDSVRLEVLDWLLPERARLRRHRAGAER
jgi:hypothetical protein